MSRILFGLAAICLLASVCRAADDQDARIRKLEELVKAQAAKLEVLEKKEAASQARAAEIKLDATIQRAIDKAVSASAQTGGKYGGAFLSADEPDVKGHRLYFTGEYTYTKVQKGNTTYAYHNAPNSLDVGLTGTNPIGVGEAINNELDWAHGYRLGAGYRLPYDGWDLYASYQHMSASSQSATSVDSSAGTPFLYLPDFILPVNTARSKLDFEFNKVNFELGRRSKLTKTLSMRVFGGPSIVWFSDKEMDQYWDSGELFFPAFDGVGRGVERKLDTHALLYGIRFGAEGDFKLGKGVSIYGKAAGSLLTGNQKHDSFRAIDFTQDGTFQNFEVIQDTHTEFHQIVPALEVAAGVGYERKLNENFNLKLNLGYEFSNYFNVLESTTALILLRGEREKYDMGMHGIVFRVKLDF